MEDRLAMSGASGSSSGSECGEETTSCSGTSAFGYDSGLEDESEEMFSEEEGRSLPQLPGLLPVPTVLHWVRLSALRVHDNPALNHAFSVPNVRFKAVFIIDPWFVGPGDVYSRKMGMAQLRFLLEALYDLDKRLRSYNSRLYVVQGQPLAVMERLCREWSVTEITYQEDMEPHSRVLEQSVDKLAKFLNIEVTKFAGHTLYNPARVLAANGNRLLTSFKEFKQLIPLLGSPEKPVEPPEDTLMDSDLDYDSDAYRIPTMKELGFPGESLYTNSWVGGEMEALRRLPAYCELRGRDTTNQVDMLFDKSSLSPYIRFGCLSVRFLLQKVKWYSQSRPSMEKVAKELTFKLLQREFFFIVSAQVPNFDHCTNNPICLPLPWEDDVGMLQRWREGRTGYPWIDAAMRQLRKEGWIHHILRESVATFLTRGDLWISWEQGKDAFEEMLLDYEPSVSCGCWMKSSCSAFITGPIEHYCPIALGQKIDPEGQFVRVHVPELKNFPKQYLYAPWKAPHHVQLAAGCVIGVDYPHPIVDHTTAGALCCERLRRVMSIMQQFSLQNFCGKKTIRVDQFPANSSHA